MTLKLVFLFRLLNILLLLISGQQCLQFNPFTDASSKSLPINPNGVAATSILTGKTRPTSTPSNIKSALKTRLGRRQINTPTEIYGKVILTSATRTLTPRLEPKRNSPSLRRRQALIGDLLNSLAKNFGLVDSIKAQVGPVAQRQTQVTQSPLPVVSDNRMASTSTSKVTTPTSTPTPTPTPTPTQVSNLPISTNDSSKSRLPATSSTSSYNAKSTAAKGSHPSSEHTSSASPSQPSHESTPNNKSTSESPAHNLSWLYKSSNRLAPLAIIVTCGLAFGCLVTLISMVKCLCHRRRFANKKDYPEGFPWVPPTPQPSGGEGRREGLLSRTASLMSARNSITPSAHFQVGHLHGDSRANSYYVEYQLNDLRSPSDVDANYLFALGDDCEKVLEKERSNSPDDLPSSSSTEESSQLASLELSLDAKPDNWDMRSANASPNWFMGELPKDRSMMKSSK